ncbi:uncharacterized protein A4U43_UnF6710 [Asparagus officinalis]|uniref:Gnk2-homologous domain-containing protein n=1 Tax=Asparagus officinalis TaxID=4686 RepID=A0A1R3L6D9_ASPOF|nr:uncharacterized protein A4U43_UnF6710 [Asparagus officinalis]
MPKSHDVVPNLLLPKDGVDEPNEVDDPAKVGPVIVNDGEVEVPKREAVIWYDSCELRYSDFNFFGIPDTAGFSMSNPNQKTSSREPFAVVADLVKAAPLNKPLMFASKALVNDDDNIYALAQCTVDLGVDGCRECLTTILADIKNCCTQWRGWRYLATSCWVRYESTPFLKNLNGTPTEITQYSCSDSTFPSNSLAIVESNLNNLLQILTTNAQTSGFYNTTVGENPDQLYGLALCRGDLTPPSNDCNTCLANARGTIIGDCPNNTQGIKWALIPPGNPEHSAEDA